MGVHGLTTYLRENKRSLSKTYQHSFKPNHDSLTPIVVDGWSFIYALHQNSGLPWAYGGEYDKFHQLVTTVVQAWINVGFKVYFVFDGAYPELKLATQVSRLVRSHIQPSLLFFRTSPISRGTAGFLHETRIIPPLCYSACLQALETLSSSTEALEIHHADEEGDPYAVELAGRIGGYVVGNDSDFVVLNSDGYRGYIPFDEMLWTAVIIEDPPALDSSSDFQPVRNGKGKRKPLDYSKTGKGIIPPDTSEGVTLSFSVYSPTTLASHLKLPITLLPLLGALVGNDYTTHNEASAHNVQALFFERSLTLSKRIERVANTIRTILSPSSSTKKTKHQVGSVMDLIDRTVNALLTRSISTMASGEVESIVDSVVGATLQYAIPKFDGDTAGQEGLWATDICALHTPEVCPILPVFSRLVAAESTHSGESSEELSRRIALRSQYLEAYRQGCLSPQIMDILSTGTYWPRLFLENPDLETVGRSIGRPLREWVYAILDDAVGLPATSKEADDATAGSSADNETDEGELDSDSDELIDVVESDEDSEIGGDPLAPLKGALQRLHDSDDESTEPPASVNSKTPRNYQTVIEHLRRGTRISQDAVVVTPLGELLSSLSIAKPQVDDYSPLTLWPEEERLSLLLGILGSDQPLVRKIPENHLIYVLALRWVTKTLHLRAKETGSKEREKEKWTRREAHCFLASCTQPSSVDATQQQSKVETPKLDDRNIQLMSQICMALESIRHLSQTLLLTKRVPLLPYLLSGKRFHGYLTGLVPLGNTVSPLLHDACEAGIEVVFAGERTKRVKKPKINQQQAPVKANRNTGGLFGILGDVEA